MKVYILEASQGSYSDRQDWIVGVYTSIEACLKAPENKDIPLKKEEYDSRNYYSAVVNPEDSYDSIYYHLGEHEVLDLPKVN